jgi:hypothetical protein
MELNRSGIAGKAKDPYPAIVEGPPAKSTPFGVPEFHIRRRKPLAFKPVGAKGARVF